MTRPLQAWMREATTRYLTDPEFHGRIAYAVALTESTAESHGMALSKTERDGLVQAAVYGLMMADVDDISELGFTNDMVVDSMRSCAEAMGLSVVAEERD